MLLCSKITSVLACATYNLLVAEPLDHWGYIMIVEEDKGNYELVHGNLGLLLFL